MIYKNNLSKLAMLLLAGTMAFATSCSDDETTGEANKKEEKSGDKEEDKFHKVVDFSEVLKLTPTDLTKYKTFILGLVDKIITKKVDEITKEESGTQKAEAVLENAQKAVGEMEFDTDVKSNLDDTLVLVYADKIFDFALDKTHKVDQEWIAFLEKIAGKKRTKEGTLTLKQKESLEGIALLTALKSKKVGTGDQEVELDFTVKKKTYIVFDKDSLTALDTLILLKNAIKK